MSDLWQHLLVPVDSSSSSASRKSSKYSASPLGQKQVDDNSNRHKENGRGKRPLPQSPHTNKPCTVPTRWLRGPKKAMMEVDSHPSAVELDGSGPANPNVLNIDDYLAAHIPATKLTPLAPIPRAVGARSSKHTIALHEKYQAMSLPQPEFVFEGGSVQGWRGKVVFRGLLADQDGGVQEMESLDVGGLGDTGRACISVNGDVEVHEKKGFSSKQEAKEKLSEGALVVLGKLEAEGRVVKRSKAKKQKTDVAVEIKKLEQAKDMVNYVGLLLEFQRATAAPQPIYTDYQLGTGFTCILTMDSQDTPNSPPQTFGSLNPPYFSSKKGARQNAARTAVEHFKAAGLWPELNATGGIKKKKPVAEHQQRSRRTSSAADVVGTGTGNGGDSPQTVGGNGESYCQQVAKLAALLSLPTPQYTVTASETAQGFHTVHCTFPSSTHPGPHGEARHIFGKKKAKEECARLTLEYLVRVKEARLKYGMQVMQGVVGGKGVVLESALGSVVAGDAGVERGVVGRMEGRAKSADAIVDIDMDVDDSDEEGFESAVE